MVLFVICITVIFEEPEEGEDNLNVFLASPILPVAEKIVERRKTDSPRTNVSDIPIRNKSRSIHSSKLAMSSSTPKIVLEMPNNQLKVDEQSKPSATTETLDNNKNGVGKRTVFMMMIFERIPNSMKIDFPSYSMT